MKLSFKTIVVWANWQVPII